MATETIISGDAAIISSDSEFSWGAVIAGALVAIAVSFFLIVLGAGIGLALVGHTGPTAFFTLGGIYFFAAQAFGMAAGGHLVGRLIGPMPENTREEEFRAGAHGLVMWGLAVVASLLIVGLSSAMAAGTLSAGLVASQSSSQTNANNSYLLDRLFVPASNSPQVAGDKTEAARILAHELAQGDNPEDSERLARMVAADTGISHDAAMSRVQDTEARMHQAADTARKSALWASLWTAFALLFGAIVAVAAAISARWEDDKLSFGFERRTR